MGQFALGEKPREADIFHITYTLILIDVLSLVLYCDSDLLLQKNKHFWTFVHIVLYSLFLLRAEENNSFLNNISY